MSKLDRIDLKILDVLSRDGRITKLRLAEVVNLSPAACWERLRRLESDGIIAGYGARINLERLGPVTTILVEVTLRSHRREDFRRFEATIAAEPEIVACDATGGGVDYVLRVVTTGIEAYQALVERLLAAEIAIDTYFTYVVTKRVKTEAFSPGALGLAG
jgi:Lrp/AsnC family transcriptional regulator, regulator of ectoine-degradation genes